MPSRNRYHWLLLAKLALVSFGLQLDDQVITFAVLPFQMHGRANAFQFTGGDDRQSVAEQISFVQMMRREDDRATWLVLENKIPDRSTREWIDT